MTRKIRAAALLASVAALGTVVPVALGGDGPRDGETSTLRLTAKESQYSLLDLGTPGYSHGDQLVFADDLSRNGRPAGEDGRTCTIVRLQAGPRVTVLCTASLLLEGQGQISAQGLLTFAGTEPPKTYSLPIVGGSGAFKRVRGDVRVEEVTEHSDRYALRLTY